MGTIFGHTSQGCENSDRKYDVHGPCACPASLQREEGSALSLRAQDPSRAPPQPPWEKRNVGTWGTRKPMGLSPKIAMPLPPLPQDTWLSPSLSEQPAPGKRNPDRKAAQVWSRDPVIGGGGLLKRKRKGNNYTAAIVGPAHWIFTARL